MNAFLNNLESSLKLTEEKSVAPRALQQLTTFKQIDSMTKQVAHPMVKFQRKVASLVESQVIKPNDSLGKIALLFGDDWTHWKKELLDFGFTVQDPISELLLVEAWDEE
jgi:hypothetical protein